MPSAQRRARSEPWRRALCRKLPAVTNRLRTLLVAADGRVFLSTPHSISALHSTPALNKSIAPSDLHPLQSALFTPRSTHPPAVAHHLVFSPSSSTSRKDTSLHLSDVTSLTLLHDAFLAVVVADGTLHLIECRTRFSRDGDWGGLWGAWPNRPAPIAAPSDLKAVCSTRLFTASSEHQQTYPSVAEVLVVARASGVYLYHVQGLLDAHFAHVAPHHRLTDKWSAVIACCDTVRVTYNPEYLTVIAVAHEHGHLAVYSSHAMEHVNAPIKSELLWTVSLQAPISSLSFCSHSSRSSALSLLVAVGNDLVLVEWGIGSVVDRNQWHEPLVTRVEQAHQSLASAVQLVADGTVVSAATDGCLLQWHIESTAHDVQTARNMQCSVVVEQQPDAAEPIMSATTTLNGLGVFVVTTSLRSRTEVGEPSKGNIRKYLGSGRRSSISLFMLPMRDNVDAIDTAIGKCIDRFLSPAWIGRPINMWDVQEFVSHVDTEKNGLTLRLYQRFSRMYEMHERTESGGDMDLNTHPRWLRQQRAMVLLKLCSIITRSGLSDVDAIEQLSMIGVKLRKFLLCMHYDNCIRLALQRDDKDKSMQSFSDLENKSLESMCEFVSICSSMNCEATQMQARVIEVRERLQNWMATGGSAHTLCPICECEDVHSPLVADEEELMLFFCESRELFVRCVKSGLPCLDVVPLQCVGCEARAVQEQFGWIDSRNKCALCNCEMVASSVEYV
ncbi:hypothetical protein BWQ96_04180 [Gracilariopsis chorda]|uniref:Uncharacterized protein n=1 Tax=Gracilariopsis chorda TaxID=448386 RepID=A0A2V3IV88_9FLOR|nr:hypothetical protein BWQ96_04180 [Gracilariopsis chorda]|eukprot:PXF46005.1 hypothetical protein BWQ96_04180 [Gracilariopsis chorda]